MRRNQIDVVTLGCSKNLVDSERLISQFLANGYKVKHNPEKLSGELVVLNTCGFIGDAQEESINTILEYVELKKRRQIGRLIVMGCLTERFMDELKVEIPEVDAYYGKFNWKDILADLGKSYYNDVLSSGHTLTTPSHYAYLKISEGCNRQCSYCAIPIITGKHRSREIEDIVAEARELVASGVKEIQLIAQDLTYYGLDCYKRKALPELVDKLSRVEGLEWLRLHYAYPNEFPRELMALIRERSNVCSYMDIALQHISDPMLEKMRRGVTKQETYELIEWMRKEVPELHLRTTLMVGHPGETEEDFQELLQFVRDVRFERLGAFIYSHEKGTYADRHYSDDVPQEVKAQRLDTLMHLQEEISQELNAAKVGRSYKVIIDREEPDYYVGRTEYDSPEVDQEVLIHKREGQELQIGAFYQADIVGYDAFDLMAEVK